MAFRKALKKTAIIGGGAVATVFGLSHLIEYRKTQVRYVKCLILTGELRNLELVLSPVLDC
uniref:Uncharacterized protein n=1 Tax=Seriola lalandi dorsalis TaxID=1841481 RepID=A0A3B4XRT5_SERLL